jgi:HNH endonuclease
MTLCFASRREPNQSVKRARSGLRRPRAAYRKR